MCTTTCVWKSEHNLGCLPSPSTLRQGLSFATANLDWASWLVSSQQFSSLCLLSCHRHAGTTEVSYCTWLYMCPGDPALLKRPAWPQPFALGCTTLPGLGLGLFQALETQVKAADFPGDPGFSRPQTHHLYKM